MGLREHVLDLLAGIDIPLGHIVSQHILTPGILQRLMLTGGLHDGEGLSRIHAHMHQIDHDIISTTDGILQGGDALQNQILCIV